MSPRPGSLLIACCLYGCAVKPDGTYQTTIETSCLVRRVGSAQPHNNTVKVPVIVAGTGGDRVLLSWSDCELQSTRVDGVVIISPNQSCPSPFAEIPQRIRIMGNLQGVDNGLSGVLTGSLENPSSGTTGTCTFTLRGSKTD